HDAEIDSGDLGYLDDEGYLYVTGRYSNLIITGYGRNISPEWIESELVAHPAIAQAAVFGDETGGITAVLVPAAEISPAQLADVLDDINSMLPDYARINRHIVAPSPFRIDTGELTPGGALVRSTIAQRYMSLARRPLEETA
ncbi:MAG TPA: long-chain acyl-CoA synthetase, partial [Gammaproteobacteria bacterium]|nr:long-chain acyl-CoA synthetase [Gammaproteobacteria bacterium]